MVTGGAGFIGSHLVDRLVSEGHNVVVVDDLSVGKLRNQNKGAVFYHANVADPALTEVFEREKPYIVCHHAAQVGLMNSVKDPVGDAEVNVLGTVRLLDLSRQYGVEKFVFSSPANNVYGDIQYLPCDEAHPINPDTPFGLSKRVAEEYVVLYSQMYRLNYAILRYGNVFGPRQTPLGGSGVVSIFVKTMLEGKQPRIFGDGEQERDFLYVDDAVEANILAIEDGRGIYNVGVGEGTSINLLFDLLKDILRYKWRPIYGPARPGEIRKIILDSSRITNELGWRPNVELAEGLARTVDYFRSSEDILPAYGLRG